MEIYSQHAHVKYCILAAAERDKCNLSAREIETMMHVVSGLTTTEIASEMSVSAHTVNTYLRRIFEKFDVKDRVSAAMRFLALGFANQ